MRRYRYANVSLRHRGYVPNDTLGFSLEASGLYGFTEDELRLIRASASPSTEGSNNREVEPYARLYLLDTLNALGSMGWRVYSQKLDFATDIYLILEVDSPDVGS